eukprot:scaffold12713_cov112-Isochrysis_galbana.AAC.3
MPTPPVLWLQSGSCPQWESHGQTCLQVTLERGRRMERLVTVAAGGRVVVARAELYWERTI